MQVDARIGFGVIADYGLRRAEACTREGRIAIDARAHVRPDRARCRTQDNFVVFRQRNRYSVRASDRFRSLCDELKNLIQSEWLLCSS